jgi:hypothetical protein
LDWERFEKTKILHLIAQGDIGVGIQRAGEMVWKCEILNGDGLKLKTKRAGKRAMSHDGPR